MQLVCAHKHCSACVQQSNVHVYTAVNCACIQQSIVHAYSSQMHMRTAVNCAQLYVCITARRSTAVINLYAGQAFASGAFLVHDSFQDEDHALFNILHSDPARYARVSRHLQNVAPPHAWFSRKPLLYGIDIDEISYEVYLTSALRVCTRFTTLRRCFRRLSQNAWTQLRCHSYLSTQLSRGLCGRSTNDQLCSAN